MNQAERGPKCLPPALTAPSVIQDQTRSLSQITSLKIFPHKLLAVLKTPSLLHSAFPTKGIPGSINILNITLLFVLG